MESKDFVEFMELDEDFHYLLCLGVSFNRSWRIIQPVKSQLYRNLFVSLPQLRHAALMFHQYCTIFEAVKNGYPEVAANEIAKHLTVLWASIDHMTSDGSSFSR